MFKLAKTLLAIALAAITLAMTGCSQSSGLAATVGSHEITMQELQDAAEVLAASQKEITAEQSVPAALGIMIRAHILRDAVKGTDKQVKDSDREEIAKRYRVQPEFASSQSLKGLIHDDVDSRLVMQALGDSAAVKVLFDKADVTINPRYGSWDSEGLVDPSGGSLSSLATAAPKK